MLASLSSLLEVPSSQHQMERGYDPMQSPWLLRAPPWKRRAFVKCGEEEVSMTNVLAHANSEEDVNEVFTEVLEAMDSNETGGKKTTAAKPAASGTGGARQRKNQNGAGNAAAHKCPSSDEVKLWSKFPLSSKSKVNIWRIAQHQLCMDRERAEVQYRPKTTHLGCPEIACKFDHI